MPKCLLGGTYEANYLEGEGYHVTCSIPDHNAAAYAAASQSPAVR